MKKLIEFANNNNFKIAKIKYDFQGLTTEIGYSLFKDNEEYSKEFVEIKPCSKSFIDKRKYIIKFENGFKYADNISQVINILKQVDLTSIKHSCLVNFNKNSILN